MKFLIGKKGKMTQVFDGAGQARAVTAVSISPMVITQIKEKEKDGYIALQVGYGEKKDKNIDKPTKGRLKKSREGVSGFKELLVGEGEIGELDVGDELRHNLEEGDKVLVSGVSKGKGFQGVVKRYNFAGGPRSHGQRHSEREPGSIGATGPQRVFKGTRMAGRMGGKKVTIKNLEIVKIDEDKNIIYISGAVPGRTGTVLQVKSIE